MRFKPVVFRGLRGEFLSLGFRDNQFRGSMVATESPSVMEDVDEEGCRFLWEGFLGHQFLFTNRALNEVPLATFPGTCGGREVDPSFRNLILARERCASNATVGIDVRYPQLREGGAVSVSYTHLPLPTTPYV